MTEKELIEFMRGERSVVRGDLILSRECTANSEFYYVSSPQDEEFKPILQGWAKRVKPKREPMATISEVPTSDMPKKPRHTTGGKRPYAMLMQDKSDIIRGLSVLASGIVMKIICADSVEWQTGRVICKRSKKPLTVKMMCDQYNMKLVDLRVVLAELNAEGVMRYDKKKQAYFVNRDLVKKGGFTDAD